MKRVLYFRNSFLLKLSVVLVLMVMLFHHGIPVMGQEKEVMAAPVEMGQPKLMAKPAFQGWTIAVHGGAGGQVKGTMPAATEKQYLDKLTEALELGSKILAGGGSSLNAVEAVVRFMEDCPLFNAGKGAVLNENGKFELDASIMDGQTGKAGAVAGVTNIKNPVAAARLVMDKTSNVMLIGKGAEDFAKSMKLALADSSYFVTPERLEAWKKWKLNPAPEKEKTPAESGQHGTVGAVAIDQKGNMAAATSTGGVMGKKAGRVGDSPIIGAGTYANNRTCAVSATGQGEFFIRNVVAYDLSALIQYKSMKVDEAAKMVIMNKLKTQKASGGLIAVDKNGNVAMPFNTNAMFRGFAKSTGEKEVAIY
jgi:L-asparaginase / beta-aspartyl-peptidase